MKRYLLWIVSACICLMGTAAIAEETAIQLEPVVVTATKTPKKLENVPAVSATCFGIFPVPILLNPRVSAW
ncbi:MAG: hypothetical protein JRI36_13990 [Deltaproteobacteria bacterium]|nr:hypothetical protein [Deltaproteobacteria bacterium]